MKWFPKWRTGSADRDTGKHVERLEQKIDRLESLLLAMAEQKQRQGVVVRQLHIHQPVLENVTFRLDALDIDELSGSLNLGNNFDVQLDPHAVLQSIKKTKQPAASKPESSSAAGSGLSRTPAGFSYRTASRDRQSADPKPNPERPI